MLNCFFDNLQFALNQGQLGPRYIWHMHETGTTTVQKPNKVVARQGFKQVGKMSPGARGSLVIIAVVVSATGNVVLPFFYLLLRAHFYDYFLNSAPPGGSGAATPPGWMNELHFVEFNIL